MTIEIFIVDDEEMIRWTLREALESEGYKVTDFCDGEQFLQTFRSHGCDIVFLDIRLPGKNGMEILQEVHKIDPTTPTVMMTAFGDVETAINAMKFGAIDYLSKPYNLAEVSILVKKIVDQSILRVQLGHIKEKIDGRFQQILGENVKMKILRDYISRAAHADKTTVLIRGESGTGKELVARQIHYQSSRAQKPFIDINAAAVTGTLLESELFGHEKGAFTDAQRQRKGVFEVADTGTLFFDEIGDLSLDLQTKLLRVLQEKRFRRVGGSVDINVDVRIIAATNANLEKAMDEGRWRRDLFYRLNVFTIMIPPLRERKDDVVLLAKYFLDQFRGEFNKEITGFAAETLELLMGYPFPGNVRELKNLIERATLLETGSTIRSLSFPDELRLFKGPEINVSAPPQLEKPWELGNFSIKSYLDSIERQVISNCLHETRGKKSKAAKLLGLTRFALRHLIKKHSLEDSGEE